MTQGVSDRPWQADVRTSETSIYPVSLRGPYAGMRFKKTSKAPLIFT